MRQKIEYIKNNDCWEDPEGVPIRSVEEIEEAEALIEEIFKDEGEIINEIGYWGSDARKKAPGVMTITRTNQWDYCDYHKTQIHIAYFYIQEDDEDHN